MPARMAETNEDALKETLCAQQQLLQKLYNELDEERESASTAASEALSMILRLQGEKAAVRMEAEQYKRLAEEKMCYAEQSMELFEDLIYQKEMEIAALGYQVQSYRYKLLSLGCNEPGVGEIKFPDNLLQRNESLIGETSVHSIPRRNSAPLIPLRFSSFKNKGVIERERSESPEIDLSLMAVEEDKSEEFNDQNSGSEKQYDVSGVGDICSYWEQIRKLDEQVKEIAGEGYANLRSRSRSSSQLSQVSSSMQYDSSKRNITNENEVTTNSSCSVTVHDVFEVPQTCKTPSVGENQTKDEGKLIVQGNEKCAEPASLPNEAVKLYVKVQSDSLNDMLVSKNCEPNQYLPHDGLSVGCHMAIVHPTVNISESQPEFQQFNRTSEIVEVQTQELSQEVTNDNQGEEELKLLKEIQEQLKSIQSEIKSLKPKKPSPQVDMSMVSEAMLHFWL